MNRVKRPALGAMVLLASQVQQVHAAAPLGTMALRLSNLRPGYALISAAYRTQLQMAREYRVSVARLTYYGWISSYDALYARRDVKSLSEVGNKIDHYSSAAGADWGYRVAVQNTLCCGKYHTVPLPQVGQQSTGFLANSGASGFIGIKFREGAYVVGVSVLPGTKRASLLLLARLVDQRVRLYGR